MTDTPIFDGISVSDSPESGPPVVTPPRTGTGEPDGTPVVTPPRTGTGEPASGPIVPEDGAAVFQAGTDPAPVAPAPSVVDGPGELGGSGGSVVAEPSVRDLADRLTYIADQVDALNAQISPALAAIAEVAEQIQNAGPGGLISLIMGGFGRK